MNHHLEPPRLCVTVKFLNLGNLCRFVEDYQDLITKLKVVIHIEPDRGENCNSLFDELQERISISTHHTKQKSNNKNVLANIPIFIYVGSRGKSLSPSPFLFRKVGH